MLEAGVLELDATFKKKNKKKKSGIVAARLGFLQMPPANWVHSRWSELTPVSFIYLDPFSGTTSRLSTFTSTSSTQTRVLIVSVLFPAVLWLAIVCGVFFSFRSYLAEAEVSFQGGYYILCYIIVSALWFHDGKPKHKADITVLPAATIDMSKYPHARAWVRRTCRQTRRRL